MQYGIFYGEKFVSTFNTRIVLGKHITITNNIVRLKIVLEREGERGGGDKEGEKVKNSAHR